jgi:prepilin-type N-terminal cleavage/methylation domain-containing protein
MTIKKNNRGFTYIELVFVIVALGILTLAVMGRNRFGIEEYSALAEEDN